MADRHDIDRLKRLLIMDPIQETLRDVELRAHLDYARTSLFNKLGIPAHLVHDQVEMNLPERVNEAILEEARQALERTLLLPRGVGKSTAPISAEPVLEQWRKVWPEVGMYSTPPSRPNPFYNAVMGVPFNPEEFQQKPHLEPRQHIGTISGRMSSRRGPEPQRIPRRVQEKQMPHIYTDSNDNNYGPQNAHEFRDGHLVNAVRKLRRESHNKLGEEYGWMAKELQKRGLGEVALDAPNSLQKQAIGYGWGGGPQAVRRVIIKLRDKHIHERLNRLEGVSLKDLRDLAKSMGLSSRGTPQKVVEDILAVEFPILPADWPLFKMDSLTDPETGALLGKVITDQSGRTIAAEATGDVYLSQMVHHASEQWKDGDIPVTHEWLFGEFVRRGLHREVSRPYAPRIHARHLPLISRLEEELATISTPTRVSTMSEREEVPLSDLVKTKPRAAKDSLFSKLRQREKNLLQIDLGAGRDVKTLARVTNENYDRGVVHLLVRSYADGGQMSVVRELAQQLGCREALNDSEWPNLVTNRLDAMMRASQQFSIVVPAPTTITAEAVAEEVKETTMSESQNSLEAELAAHEARVAELKAQINEQKGIMGHPTAVMLKGGVVTGTKLLAATEAMDAVEALARKIALKFFIPEGHEEILDTPQGQLFVDLAMPTALHLAASQGLFGKGSEFVAATGEYAFIGNWFKHGKVVTSKVKEVMGEFAGELNQLKEMGQELMGFGQSDNLLAEVTDFAAMNEEMAKTKEKVEAKS